MSRKIFVTGGAGFIGSNYVRHVFANTDDSVTVYDALTWLQESLVQAMLGRGDLGPPGRVGPGD